MYLGIILLYLLLSSIAAFFVKNKSWQFSLVTTIVAFLAVSAFTIGFFVSGYTGGFVSPESYAIPGAPGISFSIAASGFTAPLIVVSSIVFLAAVLVSRKDHYSPAFFALLLFAEFGMFGLLLSRDFLFFYVFWEVVLIPVYFMMSRYARDGGRTSLKFFVYTQVGSIFMLLSIFSLYSYYDINYGTVTLSISSLMSNSFFNILSPFERDFIFFGFFLAFLVKMPSFPVHAWFPDSYERSPYPVTIILTGALSMMGGYGFFGILLPVWKFLRGDLSDILIALGIISIVYFAFVAMFQVNLKRMMSYASAAAMGFVTLSFGSGIAALSAIDITKPNSNAIDLSGGMFQMVAHALIMVLIFSVLYFIMKNTGRESVYDLGGIYREAPRLSSLFLLGLLASLGLPGLAGFIGEFSIVVGSYAYITYIIFIVILGMLITASYHIWSAQRTLYGPYNETIGAISDVNVMEFALLLMLGVLIVVLGLFPNLFYGLFLHYLGGIA